MVITATTFNYGIATTYKHRCLDWLGLIDRRDDDEGNASRDKRVKMPVLVWRFVVFRQRFRLSIIVLSCTQHHYVSPRSNNNITLQLLRCRRPADRLLCCLHHVVSATYNTHHDDKICIVSNTGVIRVDKWDVKSRHLFVFRSSTVFIFIASE